MLDCWWCLWSTHAYDCVRENGMRVLAKHTRVEVEQHAGRAALEERKSTWNGPQGHVCRIGGEWNSDNRTRDFATSVTKFSASPDLIFTDRSDVLPPIDFDSGDWSYAGFARGKSIRSPFS